MLKCVSINSKAKKQMTYEEEKEEVRLQGLSYWDFIAEKLQAEYTCMRCKIKYNRMNFDKLRICPKCTNKESK